MMQIYSVVTCKFLMEYVVSDLALAECTALPYKENLLVVGPGEPLDPSIWRFITLQPYSALVRVVV
jgi:hypothetical protein